MFSLRQGLRRTSRPHNSLLSFTQTSRTTRSSSNAATTSSWLNDAEVKPSTKFFDIEHPRSGKKVARVHALDEEETGEVINRSHAAFKSWRLRPASERRDVLLKAASLLQQRKETFRELYRQDTSVSDAVLDIDFGIALAGLKEAATAAMASMGEIPSTQDGSLALITREPYGVVLSIAPFNFGLTLSMRTIAGPLSCGNTVIMKASPLIPSLHSALGPLFKEAGLPANVLQVVNFSPDDTPERIEQCISHQSVRMVNFTGSTKVGKIIGSLCGQNVKPCLLELGGKAPAIVLPSAKMDVAANNILAGALLHSGQICMSTERVIVVEEAIKPFTAALVRATDALIAARGREGMELARPKASTDLQELVEDAVAKGAKTLHQSSDYSSSSSASPIILTDVEPEAKIFTEETFAPACIIVPAKDLSHAVELANGNVAGLSASVWTENLAEGLEVARQLESGAVHINSMTVHDEPTLPHGGFKSSGFGRFNGKWAVESFTQTKTITTSKGQELPLEMLA